MVTGRPFWKWHRWKSIGFYPYISVMCCWSVDLIFKAKLKLESRNKKQNNMGSRQPFWKRHSWKSLGFCPQPQMTCTWNLKLKFQSKLELLRQNHATYRVQKPKYQYGHQADILKTTSLKINRFLPVYILLCHWSLELIFKAKLKLEFGTPKKQYGHQAAILKVTSLKIKRLLPMATINMHMKFENEIPKQTWLMPRNHVVYRQADGRTDGQGESSIPPPPPPPPPQHSSQGYFTRDNLAVNSIIEGKELGIRILTKWLQQNVAHHMAAMLWIIIDELSSWKEIHLKMSVIFS